MNLQEATHRTTRESRPVTEWLARCRPRRRYLVLCVLLAGLWGIAPGLREIASAGPHQSIGVDLDTRILLGEVQRRPRLADTLYWWHGPWQPEARYFRPATILLFWLEYKVFGPNGYAGFMLVFLGSHLLMMVVAFFLLSELIGPIMAALSLAIYGTNAADLINLPTAEGALLIWKDNCDVWCSTVYLLSGILFLKYLRTGRINWYVGAIAAFVGAICFKEVGFMVPVFLLLIAWYDGRLNRYWPSLILPFVVAPLLFLYRYWALAGRAAHTGNNGSWYIRWANDGAGLRGGMVSRDLLPLSIVLVILLGYALLERKFRRGAIFAALIAACIVTSARGLDMSLGNTMLRYCDGQVYTQAVAAAITVFLYWSFWRFRDRRQLFAYLMIVVTFVPLATQPPTSNHVVYFVALSWGVFLGFSLVELLDIAARGTGRWWKPVLAARCEVPRA